MIQSVQLINGMLVTTDEHGNKKSDPTIARLARILALLLRLAVDSGQLDDTTQDIDDTEVSLSDMIDILEQAGVEYEKEGARV